MREIKFRVWDKQKQKMWVEAVDIKDAISNLLDDDINWLQYTGLKDKNGIEIYEGDILKQTFGRHYWIYRVQQSTSEQFGNNLWAIQLKNNLTTNKIEVGEYDAVYTYQEQEAEPSSWNHCPSGRYTEVIGNIYQNPEYATMQRKDLKPNEQE
jgi:uncharacterized phage protein (TIGR01671 family)